MKRYTVVISSSAEADITDSFIWGTKEWGVRAAEGWANELRTQVLKNLTTSPLKYPVAPDRDGSGLEYRQMFVGRYRVIFHVEKSEVRIVHVTGSFVDRDEKSL